MINPHAEYLGQQVLGAGPLQLVLMLYEITIAACRRKDGEQARRALLELIGALDFEASEIAVNLFSLYDYCLRRIREGNFEEAAFILKELKEAWQRAQEVGNN